MTNEAHHSRLRDRVPALTLLAVPIALLTLGCGSAEQSNTSTPNTSDVPESIATSTSQPVSTTADAPPPTTSSPTTTSSTSPPSTTSAPVVSVPPVADAADASEPDRTVSSAEPLPPGLAGEPNIDELQAFLATDVDEPFYMVNFIKFRDEAEYADGRETDLTGREADGIYGDYVTDVKFPEIGAEVVYSGLVENDILGGSDFDLVAVARYPSRTAFASMSADPEFQAMTVHKEAGIEETTVLATTLIDLPDAPPPENPPYPATQDDPPFAFMHVFDYRDAAVYTDGGENADDTRAGDDAVNTYSQNAGTVAQPLGVRPAAWFQVEATVIGPTGVWDEVRINTFPSHATFEELTSDPTWQSGTHHREAGLERTYAIMHLPQTNTFNGVVAPAD